uniref:probable glycosyltransferase At5g25310 n=1 Tax=Erigeron canadensis TaxID=72917 RepID=UPI001CB96BB2|nr:probable glycosyltransferase At5g25310 [Erigeron canadensis]
MATTSFIFLLISFLTITTHGHSNHPTTTSVYLSPSPKSLFSNYNKMLNFFKIYIYPSHNHTSTPPLIYTTPQESQFYNSLIKSPFITQDPTHAHLFFLPFPSSSSTRSIARLIKNIRTTFPYWNRTLGADHFYLSSTGVDSSSDRNIVELKKNSIQISCFPTMPGFFIPHKDITLPPVHRFQLINPVNDTVTISLTGYLKLNKPVPLSLIDKLNGHPDFKVEYNVNNKFAKNSKFCLFVYGYDDMAWMVEAMGSRCVPVVITDRPIQDLPLMDVIDWSEIAVFVGTSGGVEGVKRVLDGINESRYEEMMESGVTATRHLVWNEEPQPQDVFHMIVYQLWLRRHTIRYARWTE